MRSCLALIPENIERVFVAYSGGLDSSVLLHLLISSKPSFQLVPWHVNHGLIEAAGRMERFCIEQASALGLEIRIDRLDLGEVESNIEAEARRWRYRLFERHTRAGDCIVTAHHADDQAETFLLNALRASGSAGLRGIARSRRLGDTLLLRPLLAYGRERLGKYASENQVEWFDDPSNRSNRFDRNYLRNEVVPLLRRRWPGFQHALAASSDIQSEIQELLDETGALDYDAFKCAESGGYPTLDVDGLNRLSLARRKNLVRYWVAQAGLPVLPRARLLELINQLHTKNHASPEISMPGYSIRIYDRRMFLVRDTEVACSDDSFDFGFCERIEIEQLELRTTRDEIFRRLRITDRNQALTLRFRTRAGENRDRHRLKRMFQKYRVPPWERARVAQIYLDDRLEGLLI